jgi:hypothetical protein
MTNPSVDHSTLIARLEQLERRNERLSAQVRRTRVVLRLVLSLTGLGLLWGLATANQASGQARRGVQIIRANGFVIVDREGRERGSFSYNDAEHNAVLSLEPQEGVRINMGVGRDHVGLRMSHGKSDIGMGYTEKGGTYLVMYAKDGKPIFEQRRR